MTSVSARPTTPTRRLLALGAAAALVGLAGCGDSVKTNASASSSSGAAAVSSAAATTSTKPAATGPVRKSSFGVTATGDFGQKPALTLPSPPAPTTLKTDVLIQGTGAAVVKGDTLIANYLGESWKPKDGKPNVFDNSWDRGSLAAFQIGTGKVIKGWDNGLVGQKVGSRVLLSIPAVQAYGTSASGGNGLGGQDLLFVVDLVGTVKADASANGTVVAPAAGFPKVTNESGKQPTITSVAGVKVPTAPASTVLIEGTGAVIDPTKQLALQIVQTDTATGKQTQTSWGKGVEVVPAGQVLSVISVLKTKKVGSRAMAVTPTSGNSASVVVIVDVVGQF